MYRPYRGTTVVLAYASEKVTNPPTTMDELVEWMKENPGRFAYNTPGTRPVPATPLHVQQFTTSCRKKL